MHRRQEALLAVLGIVIGDCTRTSGIFLEHYPGEIVVEAVVIRAAI